MPNDVLARAPYLDRHFCYFGKLGYNLPDYVVKTVVIFVISLDTAGNAVYCYVGEYLMYIFGEMFLGYISVDETCFLECDAEMIPLPFFIQFEFHPVFLGFGQPAVHISFALVQYIVVLADCPAVLV